MLLDFVQFMYLLILKLDIQVQYIQDNPIHVQVLIFLKHLHSNLHKLHHIGIHHKLQSKHHPMVVPRHHHKHHSIPMVFLSNFFLKLVVLIKFILLHCFHLLLLFIIVIGLIIKIFLRLPSSYWLPIHPKGLHIHNLHILIHPMYHMEQLHNRCILIRILEELRMLHNHPSKLGHLCLW